MDFTRFTSKDASVPRKVADPLKAFVKEKDKMMYSADEMLVSSKAFKTVEDIRQDIGEEWDLPIMFHALEKVEHNRKEKYDAVEGRKNEFASFNDGHFRTAGEKMVSADQSLQTAIMYCRKHTKDASQANKNLLDDVNAIIKHIETNNMKGSVFKASSYAKDLKFLPTFFEKCRDIVKIQESIGKYMSSWNISAEGSKQKPSEGNKLIDKLAQEIKGTCFFIKQYCHLYFLPSEARLFGSPEEPTDPRLDDTAKLTPDEKNRRVVTYELYRRMGEYLPRIEDKLYIKCLRDATKSHGEVLQKHEYYQSSCEGYAEALKERVRKQKELEEYFKEELLANMAKEVCYANQQIVQKERIREAEEEKREAEREEREAEREEGNEREAEGEKIAENKIKEKDLTNVFQLDFRNVILETKRINEWALASEEWPKPAKWFDLHDDWVDVKFIKEGIEEICIKHVENKHVQNIIADPRDAEEIAYHWPPEERARTYVSLKRANQPLKRIYEQCKDGIPATDVPKCINGRDVITIPITNEMNCLIQSLMLMGKPEKDWKEIENKATAIRDMLVEEDLAAKEGFLDLETVGPRVIEELIAENWLEPDRGLVVYQASIVGPKLHRDLQRLNNEWKLEEGCRIVVYGSHMYLHHEIEPDPNKPEYALFVKGQNHFQPMSGPKKKK